MVGFKHSYLFWSFSLDPIYFPTLTDGHLIGWRGFQNNTIVQTYIKKYLMALRPDLSAEVHLGTGVIWKDVRMVSLPVDLGAMAMQEYSKLPRSPELEPHHRMQFCVTPRTPNERRPNSHKYAPIRTSAPIGLFTAKSRQLSLYLPILY